jgi:myo-inositol catabolism protein IolS
MKTRKLGLSDIDISCIGLGTNYVGGYGLYDNIDEDEGVRLVKAALDTGITFLDTADIYGFGRSEELVGKAIAGRRSEVVLATKGANAFVNGERTGVDNDPKYLRKALEDSLRRLNTDYVDLYYIHRYDERTRPEDSFGELMRMKEEGLIRAAGVSNYECPQIEASLQAGPIDALQSRYNLLQREVEPQILPLCEEHGISFVPWGPLAFGLLGGRYERDYVLPADDWRHRSGVFDAESFGNNLDTVEQLKEIATTNGHALSHVAMQWLLSRPAVGSVIAGAKTAAQVQSNAAADDIQLEPHALAKINAVCV